MRKGVKVRRVVRRFELWPVAKVAFFFHLLCYLLTLGVLTGVWSLADRMGTVKNLERLVSRLGWEKFEVHGDVLFQSAALIGASLAVVATIATVTLAFFYNMLSGIFGGLVLSVLQEHADGSSRSRRQRRKDAKRATTNGVGPNSLPATTENSGRREVRQPLPAAVTSPATVPSRVPTAVTEASPEPPESRVRNRPNTRAEPARSAAVPEDWEPDTVKSLFGDGDLEEDFADDFPDDFPDDEPGVGAKPTPWSTKR
jgi:Transmembrane domain of unknown function (DUF3566)